MDVQRPVSHVGSESGASSPLSGRGNGLSGLLTAALLVAALLFIGYVAIRAFSSVTADGAVKPKEFQAVFLTNGQVYFGKLSHTSSGYVKLTNIYYLQVQQTVQPTAKDSTSANNQQVSLAKLGGELHGPEDVMYVSRSQVLFWENLKTDGKVAKAIADYVAAGNK